MNINNVYHIGTTDIDNTFPFVTCYARILDRITLNPLTEFQDALDEEKVWDLGKIYYKGGYSQYIIEFDIWNNEPVVSNGFTQLRFDNAEKCNISFWKDSSMSNTDESIFSTFCVPFIQLRNSTFNNKDEFTNSIEQFNYENVYGNHNRNSKNILYGIGDHIKFQIGIKLPELNEMNETINFVTCFQYQAQNQIVNLFFKCKFKIINEIINPKIIEIKNNSKVLSGKINNSATYYSRGNNQVIVEAYDSKTNLLKDQCITINNTNNVNDLSHPYYLFLTPGIYNINIKNNIHSRMNNNIKLEDGIYDNYSYIENGLIKSINYDIVEYYSNKIEVFGYIVNQYNTPVKDVEIIISQKDKLINRCLTNELGQYKFLLNYGMYDIRIRSNCNKVIIIRNFEFTKNGLFYVIRQQYPNLYVNFDFISE